LTVHLKPYWGKPTVRNFRGGRGNPKLDRARRAPLPYSAVHHSCPKRRTDIGFPPGWATAAMTVLSRISPSSAKQLGRVSPELRKYGVPGTQNPPLHRRVRGESQETILYRVLSGHTMLFLLGHFPDFSIQQRF